jgi:hypothetical protein
MIKRTAIVIGLLLVLAGAVYAAVTCPLHNYAACYDTGQIAPTGSGAHKWHCSCGDDVWVAE